MALTYTVYDRLFHQYNNETTVGGEEEHSVNVAQTFALCAVEVLPDCLFLRPGFVEQSVCAQNGLVGWVVPSPVEVGGRYQAARQTNNKILRLAAPIDPLLSRYSLASTLASIHPQCLPRPASLALDLQPVTRS